MARLLQRLRREDGQAMVEYGIIVFLISIAAIVGIGLIGDQLVTVFNSVLTALGGVVP